MPHQVAYKRLSRTDGHRKALLRNLATSFFKYEKIETTSTKAKEISKVVERLITQDKVDFILPPWGTGLNLAVGPLLHGAGYPHLAVTALSDRASELAKLWPNSFWLLGTMTGAAQGFVSRADVPLNERGAILGSRLRCRD